MNSAMNKSQSLLPPVNTYINEAVIPTCCNNLTAILSQRAECGDVNYRHRILGSGVWVLRKTLISISETQKLKIMYM
jgi:hypothetical protein